MKKLSLLAVAIDLACTTCLAEPPLPSFKTVRLSDKFVAEGAYYGDFNRDGKLDVVAGPYWYEDPDFQKRHEVRPAQGFDPKQYSDNFLTFVGDFNGDGWPDILYIGFPGNDTYWYENPAGMPGHWKRHLVAKNVGNESPAWGDINGDGRPELIYNIDGYLGYATFDPAKPDQPWLFHAISPKGNYQKFTHGLGLVDINGDGLKDIVVGKRFWAHGPKGDAEPNAPAVIYWFELRRDPQQGVQFVPHLIDDDSGVGTQVVAADLNGDGIPDVIVSNKKGTFLYLSQPGK